MIKSFACKETHKLFKRQNDCKLPNSILRVALRKLRMLNESANINDLKLPPGNHLEKLTGDRKEQYSIRINEQWRICFEWKKGEAHHVEIIDYH